MYVHHIYVWCPGRPQESIRTLAVIGFWASNPDALTEQPAPSQLLIGAFVLAVTLATATHT